MGAVGRQANTVAQGTPDLPRILACTHPPPGHDRLTSEGHSSTRTFQGFLPGQSRNRNLLPSSPSPTPRKRLKLQGHPGIEWTEWILNGLWSCPRQSGYVKSSY